MEVLQVSYKSPTRAKDFARSLKETGFAVLVDHPIPSDLVSSVFKEWEGFFASATKNDYLFNPETQEGFFPFKTENAKGSTKKDLKEFFHLYSWNQLPRGMSNATWEHFKRMTLLSQELLSWVEEESPAEIRKEFSMPLPQMIEGSRETLLRVIHYPGLDEQPEEGAIRAAAHEDINLITLLPAATAPGLQVKDNNGKWHDVSCDPGSIAVNAGDMLQLCSQGYYRSTTHQVMNPIGEEALQPRFSMPLFLHPRADVPLSPTKTAKQYLDERLIEIGLKKK